MKVLILYRPNSEHGRRVEEFMHDFENYHLDAKIEPVNIDTRDGMAMATLYDVMDYPAILVVNRDGSVQNSWQGDQFPLLAEVAAYARA